VTNYVERHISGHQEAPSKKTEVTGAVGTHTNAFALVFRIPYLLLIAFMLLLNAIDITYTQALLTSVDRGK